MIEYVLGKFFDGSLSQPVVGMVDVEVNEEPVSLLDHEADPDQVPPLLVSHGDDESCCKLIQDIQLQLYFHLSF